MENDNSITYTSFVSIARQYGLKFLDNTKFEKPKWEGMKYVEGDGEKEVEAWRKTFPIQMRQHGSVKELVENLMIYRRFPGNALFFNNDWCEPYNTPQTVHFDLGNNPYIYKRDAFKVFQPVNRKQINIDDLTNSISQAMGNFYLKCRELELIDCVEFVRYAEIDMTEIMQEFIQLTSRPTKREESEWNEIILPDTPIQLEPLCREFRKLIPKHLPFDAESFLTIREILKYHLESRPGLEEWSYHFAFRCSWIIVDSMSKIIDARPHMFSPNAALRNKDGLALMKTLRVFVDGADKFLITEEILRATSSKSDCKVNKETSLYYIHTTPFDDFVKQAGDAFIYVEVPIMRTRHHAVPILSSTKEYYFLSADLFFSTMRELFFKLKLFQKMKLLEWTYAHDYFQKLKWFRAQKTKTLIDTEEADKISKLTRESFEKEYLKLDAPDVRNAKKDEGFNVQNLKNELVHMGLLDVFPEIERYADAAYARVVKNKRETVLRTCDLFDAIEHCQLVAVVQRFPFLVTFLHSQNACSRLVYTPCPQCLPKHSQPLLQYEYTMWKEVYPYHVKIVREFFTNSRPSFTKVLRLIFGNLFIYNISMIEHMTSKIKSLDQLGSKFRVTILDSDTFDIARKKLGEAQQSKNISLAVKNWQNQMANLEGALKLHNSKKIYLRTISTSHINREPNLRVFVDDVLELLPVLLQVQGSSPKPDMIQKYSKKWATSFGYHTIPLSEVKMVLELFCINKCNLTVIPDISNVVALEECVNDESPHFFISVLTPDNQRAMDVPQAILDIFQTVVCAVNWDFEVCKKHKDCRHKFRSAVLEAMKEYAELKEGTYINVKHVENTIEELKSHCNFKSREKMLTPLLETASLKNSQELGYEQSFTRLTPIKKSPDGVTRSDKENVTVSVWQHRNIILLSWLNLFFEQDNPEEGDLSNTVLQALEFAITMCERRANLKRGAKVDEWNTTDGFSFKNMCKESLSMLIDNFPGACSIDVSTAQKEEKGTEEPTKKVEEQKEPSKKTKPKTGNSVAPKPAPNKNESANCQKCYRTQQRCEEAKSQVKSLENEKKKLEGMVRNNCEKEVKKMEVGWKKKIEELEKKHQEELDSINSEKATMAEQLELAKSKELRFLETIAKLESTMKQQEDEKTEKINEMMKSIEVKDQTISQLKETVSAYSRSKFGECSEKSESMRRALFELKEIKNALMRDNPVMQVEDKVRRLIQMSDDANIRNGASLTLLTFRNEYLEYMKAVDASILKIQNNPNLTSAQLDALPPFPTISDGFMITYERLIKQNLSKDVYWPEELNLMDEPKEKELADKECVICCDNMTTRANTVKCRKCYRRLHDKCARSWIEQKETCPVCYSKFEKSWLNASTS